MLGSKDAADDNESEMQVDDDGPLFTGTDMFTELLNGETFSDFKDYLIDKTLLAEAYPQCSSERIRVERDFQTSFYVMKKFLRNSP